MRADTPLCTNAFWSLPVNDAVLVLGAGGFIGRRLTETLSANGHRVVAVTRTPLPDALEGVNLYYGQLRETDEFLRALEGCGAIVHAASASTPGSTGGRPLSELQGNLTPSLAMLEALQQRPDIKLVYLSSAGTLYEDQIGPPATEQSPIAPRSYHGAAKAATEHFIHAWCAQGYGSATIVRPTNVYGPQQQVRANFGIIPTCFVKMMRCEPLSVWGDGSMTRDYLYVDDLIDLCLRIIQKPSQRGLITVNASSGQSISLNDLFKELETVAGLPLLRSYDTRRSLDARHISVDSTLASSLYGWRASMPLHEGLRNTWTWLTSLPA